MPVNQKNEPQKGIMKNCKNSAHDILGNENEECQLCSTDEPQLSAEIVEKIIEYAMAESSREPDGERLWIKTSYELADILRPILTKELATVLKEQKQKYEEIIEGLKGEILEMGEMED